MDGASLRTVFWVPEVAPATGAVKVFEFEILLGRDDVESTPGIFWENWLVAFGPGVGFVVGADDFVWL